MGIESHLAHRCTIQRGEDDGPDGYRQTRQTLRMVTQGVPCRLIEKARTFVSTETAQLVTKATYSLLLPADTDIQVADNILEVIVEDGASAGKDFLVDVVLKRRNQGTAQFVAAVLKEMT